MYTWPKMKQIIANFLEKEVMAPCYTADGCYVTKLTKENLYQFYKKNEMVNKAEDLNIIEVNATRQSKMDSIFILTKRISRTKDQNNKIKELNDA